MKIPHLNFKKIISLKKALIINDDYRYNKRFFETIIHLVTKENPEIEIIYFATEHYVKIGYQLEKIWENLQNLLQQKNNPNQLVMLLMDGLEYFSKKNFNFNFNDNFIFYGICSNFIHWNNRNLFLQLIPKFYCERVLNLAYLLENQKWNDYNQLIYHYAFHLSEANNLVKTNDNWNIMIENLISQKLGFLENKKINSWTLRKIIRQIASCSFGAFSIGKFCDDYDLRYESVMLGIKFLIEIKLITEIKYILFNDFHSKKRQSMYLLNHTFIYFYLCHYSQINIPVENIVLSQLIKDFNQFNQHAPTSYSYQMIKSDDDSLLKCKFGLLEFKIDLKKDSYQKIILSASMMQKIYNVDTEHFNCLPINHKSFFEHKKINIISDLTYQKNNINLFDYLVKISL
ncbi:hypothetical protein MCAV_01780 [[Mycoplasma] cavipharyngis]|uniref:hypothetical protein n=1 Tax=[Mycoplasma] cavipharyngis TaxID=92757 RepID=UPI00370439D2